MRRAVVLAAAAAAFALTLYAGRHNPSLPLRLIFCGWVLLPFGAMTSRATPNAAALGVAAASLGIYAAEALGLLNAKTGFVFLVTPAASLALLAVTAAVSRRRSRPASAR